MILYVLDSEVGEGSLLKGVIRSPMRQDEAAFFDSSNSDDSNGHQSDGNESEEEVNNEKYDNKERREGKGDEARQREDFVDKKLVDSDEIKASIKAFTNQAAGHSKILMVSFF